MKAYHGSKSKSTKSVLAVSSAEYTPEELQLIGTCFGRLRETLREGVLSLCTATGLTVLSSLMEADVTDLVGPRGKHDPANRTAYRHGYERTSVVMGGQKVSIRRPRARTHDGQELDLPTLDAIGGTDLLTDVALARMLHGVSTRDYNAVRDPLGSHCETKGTSKSSVSRRFIEATEAELKSLLSRPLAELDIVVLLIDGVQFSETNVLAAMGFDMDGHKHILGLRHGSSENATVCKDLLADLGERGLRCDDGVLTILDGSKALRSAVKACFGKHAVIQRCQVHKRRNVLEYLPKEQRPWVKRKLSKAWAMEDHTEATKSLKSLADQLEEQYPHAASSLREGLEETVTILRLNIPGLLRQTLSTTNAIESAFDITRTRTRNVKNWQNGTMVLRWAAAGLLEAEGRFRRVRGYKALPQLRSELRRLTGDQESSETDGRGNGRKTA
jgi:putative transposase